jgi:type IV pilus assembly protein PilQ
LDVKFLLREIDTKIAQDDSTYFIYRLANISPDDAVSRFQLLQVDDAKVFALNYPLFSKELLVICPIDRSNEIKDTLKKLDVKGEKIKVPVDYSNSPAGQSRLAARREVLVKLTGIPATSFFISNNISRDTTPYFVMWVEETPENIKKIRDMIDSIDSP